MLNANELRALDTLLSTPKKVESNAGSKPGERDSPLGPRARRLSARGVEGSDQEAAVQFEDRP